MSARVGAQSRAEHWWQAGAVGTGTDYGPLAQSRTDYCHTCMHAGLQSRINSMIVPVKSVCCGAVLRRGVPKCAFCVVVRLAFPIERPEVVPWLSCRSRERERERETRGTCAVDSRKREARERERVGLVAVWSRAPRATPARRTGRATPACINTLSVLCRESPRACDRDDFIWR